MDEIQSSLAAIAAFIDAVEARIYDDALKRQRIYARDAVEHVKKLLAAKTTATAPARTRKQAAAMSPAPMPEPPAA